MAAVALASADLHRLRKQAVRRLVAPLLPEPPSITVEQIGFGRDTFTLGILPKGRSPSSILNPEDALVPTYVSGLLLNYYESWKEVRGSDQYYLDRAYMHMHLRLGGAQPRQILSLHCDPGMHHSQEHYQYKRGPHLHVEGANPNLARAHISLCLTDVELGGSDVRQLTESFRAAVGLVVKELVPCWERATR
jgi:hypothetical protein